MNVCLLITYFSTNNSIIITKRKIRNVFYRNFHLLPQFHRNKHLKNTATFIATFWKSSRKIRNHKKGPRNPGGTGQPTSTVISHVVHPLSRQSWTSCWYFIFFLSADSSQFSSHGTVSSPRIMLFPARDHMMMSGLRVVDSTASGKWSFLPRSTSKTHPWADCRRFCLAWLWTAGL